MSRVPGSPDDKRAFLSTLDQHTLPHLVGDILAYLDGHREVRVVDGPGDGKRDVHSVRPDGSRHIAQCKYHNDVNKTVGSDETDELILALSKFGCKAGLFVTTGKLSPQAKREYLDNYPSYELTFMDGLDLVDAVLSSPILSAVWFDGRSIIQVRNSLNLSFVLRAARDDRPITRHAFRETSAGGVNYRFEYGLGHRLKFEPYRPPLNKELEVFSSDSLWHYKVRCSGSINIHNVPEHHRALIATVAEQLGEEDVPAIIRLGVPSLGANVEEKERDDRVELLHIRPESFVITKDRDIVPEKDWVVIGTHDDWVFPKNLSVAEADWAGWLSRSRNTIFMQELAWPAFGEASYFTLAKHALLKGWLEHSLFIGGSKEECDVFVEGLSENDQPNWSCPYGPGGELLAWLHPMIEAHEANNITYMHSGREGKFDARPKAEIQLEDYQERLNRIRALSVNTSLTELKFNQARHIAAAAGEELLPTPEDAGDVRSAELVHYYGDVLSPVFLNERKFLFVRMWHVPSSPPEARELLRDKEVMLESGARVYWDARRGHETKSTFVLSTLIFHCPPDVSADDYFESISGLRDENLRRLAEFLRSVWSEAELATEFFWRTEVGFRIDEKGFRGNPWMIFEAKDGTRQIVYINDSSE